MVSQALRHRYRWWVLNYSDHYVARKMTQEELEVFYKSIASGDLQQVKRIVEKYPYCLMTKIFGKCERSALYVASFHGRVNIVNYMLSRGCADPLTNGYGAMDVAAMVSLNPVQRMQVRKAFGAYLAPTFVLTSKDVKAGRVTHKRNILVAIYATEPVYEFMKDDIVVVGGSIESFSSLMSERYSVRIRVTASVGTRVSIHVRGKCAKRIGATEFDAKQDPNHYNVESHRFEFFYGSKYPNPKTLK